MAVEHRPEHKRGSRVVTDIPTELALREAEIAATRQLNESVNRLNGVVETMSGKVEILSGQLIAISARNYDGQIAEEKRERERQDDIIHKGNETRETRLRAVESLCAKFGMALTIVGTVGGAVLGVIATKVFG